STHTSAMVSVGDVKVVDVRTPQRIRPGKGADKANDDRCILGDADVLILTSTDQPLLPHMATVLQGSAIEKRIAHHSTIGASPALGMQLCESLGINARRVAEQHRGIRWSHSSSLKR